MKYKRNINENCHFSIILGKIDDYRSGNLFVVLPCMRNGKIGMKECERFATIADFRFDRILEFRESFDNDPIPSITENINCIRRSLSCETHDIHHI